MSLYNLPPQYPIMTQATTLGNMKVTLPDLESQLQSMLHSLLNSPYNLCYQGAPTDASYYFTSFMNFANFMSFNYKGINNGQDLGNLVQTYYQVFLEIISTNLLDQSGRKLTGSIFINLGKRPYPMDFTNDPNA